MSNALESRGRLSFQSDWLASRPFFFNIDTGLASHNINDVIDFANVEFDPEGLINYLDFGYSVFGKTPIKNVHFLRPNQSLSINSLGKFEVGTCEDMALSYFGNVSNEDDVWSRLGADVEAWQIGLDERFILVPMSGGYDSRLLSYFLPQKDRILARTYGVSYNQARSYEVVHAQEICHRLDIDWGQVELGKYHDFIADWDALYGLATHAHGMYQWEFFSKIHAASGSMPMLSGIVGDAWAGSSCTSPPVRPEDLVKLGYSHGMHADSTQCLLGSKLEVREAEFQSERERLKDERYRVLYLVRTKLMLLSYLLEVPRKVGFQPYSPFLKLDVAMPMLTIAPERWKNRIWQRDFMDKHNLNVEDGEQNKSFRNDLNKFALRQIPLPPLNTSLLERLFKREYIDWINGNIRANAFYAKFQSYIYGVRYLGGVMRRAGLRDPVLSAYFAYLVLKPIESVLVQAEKVQRYER